MKGSRDRIFKFWYSLYISGTVEARNIEFRVRIDNEGHEHKNAKLGQRVPEKGHVTYFWNYVTPSISPKRVKLETPNVASI